jgi:hypothetical protein
MTKAAKQGVKQPVSLQGVRFNAIMSENSYYLF